MQVRALSLDKGVFFVYILYKLIISRAMAALQTHVKVRFKAVMLLAVVGDAVGYKNGDWEFLTSGLIIHKQFAKMTVHPKKKKMQQTKVKKKKTPERSAMDKKALGSQAQKNVRSSNKLHPEKKTIGAIDKSLQKAKQVKVKATLPVPKQQAVTNPVTKPSPTPTPTPAKPSAPKCMFATPAKGNMSRLIVNLSWRASDDTVLHLATARGLVACSFAVTGDALFHKIALEYKKASKLMKGNNNDDDVYIMFVCVCMSMCVNA